jgi:acetyl-CoA acetyltransferase
MAEVPIIVGVGDIANRSTSIETAFEPLQLITECIGKALEDTGLDGGKQTELQAAIDSLDVVRSWTWPYDDLPGDISRKLGVNPRHKFYTEHGGNKPAKLVDEAARRISKGQTKVAVITGGEALASCELLLASGASGLDHSKLEAQSWANSIANVN